MKAFFLCRVVNVTGVSGIGLVAEGVEFNDGTVAMRWLGETKSTVIYNNIEDVRKIHCHDDNTRITYWYEEIGSVK